MVSVRYVHIFKARAGKMQASKPQVTNYLVLSSDRPNLSIIRNQPNRIFGNSLSESSAEVRPNRTRLIPNITTYKKLKLRANGPATNHVHHFLDIFDHLM